MRQLLLLITALALLMLPQACRDYDTDFEDLEEPTQPVQELRAVVTVVPFNKILPYILVLDSMLIVTPDECSFSPFGDVETRAIVQIHFSGKKIPEIFSDSWKGIPTVKVEKLEAIPTPPVVDAADADTTLTQGLITVFDKWPTVLLDGYLTLKVAVSGLGDADPAEQFTFVTGTDPDDPCAMELRYSPAYATEEASECCLAICLNDMPQMTPGRALTVSWQSPGGPCKLRLPVILRGKFLSEWLDSCR